MLARSEKVRGAGLEVELAKIAVRRTPIIVELGKKGFYIKAKKPPRKGEVDVHHQIYMPGFGIFDNTDEERMEELCTKVKMQVGHKKRFKAGVRNLREHKLLPHVTQRGSPFIHL